MALFRSQPAFVLILLGILSYVAGPLHVVASEEEALAFDDAPLDHDIHYPPWFRLSFLNLQEDLEDALTFGKRGLIVYFGQQYCPYCRALIEGNFGKHDIEQYTRRYFDVVAIDIHGSKKVTDLRGEVLSEKAYAAREQINFTPSLIFYDGGGEEVLRLQGYYPPYKFRAALEYVADGHHRGEGFADYLQRADPPLSFEPDGLNEEVFLSPPPYALDRSRLDGEMPLVVFFEQGECHACDVLHSAPLQNAEIRHLLHRFESVQLDIWADTPVITPGGEHTTSRAWAERLGLFYTPTLLFFDNRGEEILRVDSVVGFYRLRKVLEYILDGAYHRGITLQQYRRRQGEE
jgi:thioredoxin-related protein